MKTKITMIGASLATYLIGCVAPELDLDNPRLSATLELDQPDYEIGEVMMATLEVANESDGTVSIPIPSYHCVSLYRRPVDSPDSIEVPFLDIPLEGPEFAALAPGETIQRTLIIPRGTVDGGSFRVYAVYRSEIEDEITTALPVATPARDIVVLDRVAWQRDSDGRVTEQEAARLAGEFFKAPGAAVRTRLVRDSTFRLDRWWCTVELSAPDRLGRTERSCLVNPYLPAVHMETEEHVPAEK